MSQFDADPIERRQWLSSDVGTGRSNVSPASPSADPGDRSEPGYSDNWALAKELYLLATKIFLLKRNTDEKPTLGEKPGN